MPFSGIKLAALFVLLLMGVFGWHLWLLFAREMIVINRRGEKLRVSRKWQPLRFWLNAVTGIAMFLGCGAAAIFLFLR